jgi:protoporphyrinogen oxidase
MKTSHTPVAILGAGLTGMSAALHLRKAGVPFRIFERLGHAGGHAITLVEDGFRFDRTGHLLHLRDPEMRALVMGYIGADHVEVQRRSMIWSNGVYTRYPFQANTFGLPPAVANECLLGFLKAHFAANKPQPKDFEEFCLVHFGEGISKHFMIPYNARLWGVHPKEITAAWCQRFVPMPKLEDVVAGAVGLNDRELGYNTSFVYPRLGIGELARAMARDLPEIELGRAPTSVDWKKKQLAFDGEAVTYDVLISTAPLKALGGLLAEAPEAVRAAAGELRCNHLYYLDVGTRTPCKKDYHWVYVPEAKYPFYRIGCYSHFSPAMAPPGKACFYVELADRREPDMSTLVPDVARAMVEMGLVGGEADVEVAKLRKIDWAYVVFDHHYFASLEAITPFLEANAIVSAGRYGGWNYSSMEDALMFGRDAARKAAHMHAAPLRR